MTKHLENCENIAEQSKIGRRLATEDCCIYNFATAILKKDKVLHLWKNYQSLHFCDFTKSKFACDNEIHLFTYRYFTPAARHFASAINNSWLDYCAMHSCNVGVDA